MVAYCVFLLFARLFVVVMAVCRKDIDTHYRLKYVINETVFLSDPAAPQSTAATFETFWLTSASFWMVIKLSY